VGLNSLKSLNLTNVYPNKNKNNKNNKVTRLKLHSVLTCKNPRLLYTYKTDSSNRKQERLPRQGRTRLGHDCQPKCFQSPSPRTSAKSADSDLDVRKALLPAYGRTRLLAYGQTRLPGCTICRTMAGLDSMCINATRRKSTRILTRRKSTQILMRCELTRLNLT
jgi:hypothetical protein